MDSLKAMLPLGDGLLPSYILLLSAIAVGNSVQAYATLHYSRRFYNGLFLPNTKLPPASASFNPEDSVDKYVVAKLDDPKAKDQLTPLAGRLWGTWTMVTCMVRLYAAYNIHIGPIYDMAVGTYAIALIHYVTEIAYFKGMVFTGPQILPFFFATLALIWMPMVRSHYVTFEG